jgi:hypothetical protein
MLEAIVKRFKNASRQSLHDNDFMGSIVETLLPLFYGMNIVPLIAVSFLSD